jgi:FlgD Ig-like domain
MRKSAHPRTFWSGTRDHVWLLAAIVIAVSSLITSFGVTSTPAKPVTPLFAETVPTSKVNVVAADDASIKVIPTNDGYLHIQYALPADSFVTLVIDNSEGKRIRNLIGAAPRHEGFNTETWDGTDDQGQSVPAADYQFRMLRHNGVGVDYLFSYGNPGLPPWATADGTGGWGADHSMPAATVSLPDAMVLGWPMAESGWFLIGVGLDGRKQWGLKNRYAFGDTLINLATDGQYLYVASEQNPGPLLKYYKKLAHAVLYRYSLADRKPVPIGGKDEILVSDRLDGNANGLAVNRETAYISLRQENRIAVISLSEGKHEASKDISLPAPGPLAWDKDGNLIAISGQQLMRIDPAKGTYSPFITKGLEDAKGVCVDAQGAIYVSDRGKAQQVKIFDSNGHFLRSIGVDGGRSPRGSHNPLGMYRPAGLSVDSKGFLWVMEEDDRPKRVSVWDVTTGALGREFIGAPHYGALDGAVSEFDKTMAFGEGVQYRLDWSNKTYSYVATPSRAINDQDIFGGAVVRRTFQRNGRLLTASNSHVQVVGELRDGLLRPLAAVGEIDELTRRLGMLTGAIARKIEKLKEAGYKTDARGTPARAVAFIWTDQNGDGIAQDSEFVWRENLQWGGYWGTGIGSDFAVYMQSADRIYRLPVTSWNDQGAPVYTFQSATPIPYSGDAEDVAPLPDGMLIVNAKPHLLGIDLANNQTRWSYPNPWEGVQGSHTADVPAPGRLIGPLSITGFAQVGGQSGTVFAMNGNLGQQFLMTSDGLWVTALLRDWRLAKVEDMYTVPDEDFGGYFWRDQRSGEVFLEAGKSEYRLYRVTGLDTIRRSESKFTLSSEMAKLLSTRVSEREKAPRDTPSVKVAKLPVPLPITAKLDDVPSAMRFTEVVADTDNKFRFSLGHDGTNLYLVYDVSGASLQNNGQDITQLFKTGDCADLMYGVNPKADPRRREGAAGDYRLLMTFRDQKPVAVLYNQVDPTRNWPVVFMSPSRAVYIGNVIELHDVKMAVTRSNKGYVLVAQIPLSTLGITSDLISSSLVGDVGVIYGSESGNGARLRLYWSNKDTAITSDVPSEAALTPANWGRLSFEP